MLLLLPPSEGKATPEAGPRLDLTNLTRAELTPERTRVLDSLIACCTRNPRAAAKALGLGPTQQGLVAANAHLRTAPSAAAIEIYTGVLYEALDFASLTRAAQARAEDMLAISSALFGLLSPRDVIPAYRLSADTSVPGLASLTSVWREGVQEQLTRTEGLILDMRSGAYVGLAPVPSELSDRTAAVRVLFERNGKRTVVSHHNKATKGRIARALVQSRATPRTIESLASHLSSIGFRTELAEDRLCWRIDIVINDASQGKA